MVLLRVLGAESKKLIIHNTFDLVAMYTDLFVKKLSGG